MNTSYTKYTRSQGIQNDTHKIHTICKYIQKAKKTYTIYQQHTHTYKQATYIYIQIYIISRNVQRPYNAYKKLQMTQEYTKRYKQHTKYTKDQEAT